MSSFGASLPPPTKASSRCPRPFTAAASAPCLHLPCRNSCCHSSPIRAMTGSLGAIPGCRPSRWGWMLPRGLTNIRLLPLPSRLWLQCSLQPSPSPAGTLALSTQPCTWPLGWTCFPLLPLAPKPRQAWVGLWQEPGQLFGFCSDVTRVGTQVTERRLRGMLWACEGP